LGAAESREAFRKSPALPPKRLRIKEKKEQNGEICSQTVMKKARIRHVGPMAGVDGQREKNVRAVNHVRKTEKERVGWEKKRYMSATRAELRFRPLRAAVKTGRPGLVKERSR